MTRFGRRVYRIVNLPQQQRRFLLSDSIETRAEGLPTSGATVPSVVVGE